MRSLDPSLKLARLGPRSPGWPRAARVFQPGPRRGGAALSAHKYGALENGGAVTALGTLKLVPYLPPQSRAVGRPGWQTGDRGRGEEKPCPLAAAAGTGPARVRPAGPGIYLRPRRCPPPEAALRGSLAASPDSRSRQTPPARNRTAREEATERIWGPAKAASGKKPQLLRAAEARGLGAVPPLEGACPSACAKRREGQGAVPPAKPGKARGGGVPHVSPPEVEGEGREESACVDLVVGSSSFWGQRVGSTGLDLSASSALADSSHGGS